MASPCLDIDVNICIILLLCEHNKCCRHCQCGRKDAEIRIFSVSLKMYIVLLKFRWLDTLSECQWDMWHPKSLSIHLITCTTWSKSEKCSSLGTSWFWSTIYSLGFCCRNGKGSASLVSRANHLHSVLDFRNITTIITIPLRRWYWLSWLSIMLDRLMKWEFKLKWIRVGSQGGFTVWEKLFNLICGKTPDTVAINIKIWVSEIRLSDWAILSSLMRRCGLVGWLA